MRCRQAGGRRSVAAGEVGGLTYHRGRWRVDRRRLCVGGRVHRAAARGVDQANPTGRRCRSRCADARCRAGPNGHARASRTRVPKAGGVGARRVAKLRLPLLGNVRAHARHGFNGRCAAESLSTAVRVAVGSGPVLVARQRAGRPIDRAARGKGLPILIPCRLHVCGCCHVGCLRNGG